eukprot:2780247-Prymnesium_polylepis.1
MKKKKETTTFRSAEPTGPSLLDVCSSIALETWQQSLGMLSNSRECSAPLGRVLSHPVAVERKEEARSSSASLSASLQLSRDTPFAQGGGGSNAHLNDLTTRGHAWLLRRDSPLQRPWRAHMAAPPSNEYIAEPDPDELRLAPPLHADQLAELRMQCAVLAADGIPARPCAICDEMMVLPAAGKLYEEKKSIVRLPCGHGHCFHFRCVQPWLGKARLCPTCRSPLQVTVHGLRFK